MTIQVLCGVFMALFFGVSAPAFADLTFSKRASLAGADLPTEADLLVRYGRAAKTQFDKATPIRLLDWNVHKFDPAITYENLKKLLASADIAIVQESMTDLPSRAYFTDKISGFETYAAVSFYMNNKAYTKEGTGVSTSSRVQSILQIPIRSRETEPVINTPKMVLVTEYPVEGMKETLMVANIHGLNFVPNWKFEVQLQQVEEVLQKHVGPIIFGGDFNTHNVNKALMIRHMADRLKLDYVWMDKSYGIGLKLDHVFVRGFNVKRAEVLNDVTSSDHLPLWAELEFQ